MLAVNSSIPNLRELEVFSVGYRRRVATLEPLPVAKGPSRELERDFG